MTSRVIGAGHVGFKIVAKLNIEGTNRNGPLKFDSNDLSTYDALDAEELIITFAIGKESEACFDELKARVKLAKKVLILSSVGAFENKDVIDEDTPIQLSNRYQRELELLGDHVTILYLAGIYDESRNPLQWLQKGLVSKHKKGVTLIHSDDIVRVVDLWAQNKLSAGKYILSDGVEHDWVNIINHYISIGALKDSFERPDKEIVRSEKKLDTQKIKEALGTDFIFTDFYSHKN